MHRRGGEQRNRVRLLSLCLVLLVGSQLPGQFQVQPPATDDAPNTLVAQYAQLPLAFEPNRGQADGPIQYLVHHGKAATYFDSQRVTTLLADGQAVSMSLVGAAAYAFEGVGQLPSKSNYFRGADRSQWTSDIPNYQSIVSPGIYPGIDLKYYGTNSQLEHDFIVAPGVDPGQIKLGFEGHESLALDGQGNLVIAAGGSQLVLRAPVSYQPDEDGARRPVQSSFVAPENGPVTIALGAYDPTKQLVIDPVLSFVYATPFGGTGLEKAYRLKVASDGTAYITGETSSTDFPTSSPYQAANAGGVDAFVAAFSPDGQTLLSSTYLGGSGADYGFGLDLDSTGNIYVAVQTDSTNFPTSTPFQAANAGMIDSAIVKLNPAGSTLLYGTYLGGTNIDAPSALSVGSDGSMYVAGYTQSSDYPLQNAYETGFFNTMAFVSKLAPDGQSLEYSTYLGSVTDTIDIAYCMDVDSAGSVYVAGSTTTGGSSFPTVNAFQGSHAGGIWDMFLTKFAPDGQSLEYSTYLGGSGEDGPYTGCGIAVDGDERPYITGMTDSTNFPTLNPYQAANAGGNDAFIVKFAADGQSLEYGTYFGGSGSDSGTDIEFDSGGAMYLATNTFSTDYPIVAPFYQDTAGGFGDTAVTKLAADGQSVLFSTYLRSTDVDWPGGIELDPNGDIYVAGYAESDPLLHNPYQPASAGGGDAYIAQLTLNTVVVSGFASPVLNFSLGSTTCDLGVLSASETQFCTHTMSAASNAASGYVISYIPTTTLTSGANTITAMASQTASVLGSEQFGLNLKANTAAGSFTSGNFGADPSGGTGVAMTGYEIADQFKFDVTGDDIAQTTGASNTTTYTASFIANIASTTDAGAYTATLTYTIVAGY